MQNQARIPVPSPGPFFSSNILIAFQGPGKNTIISLCLLFSVLPMDSAVPYTRDQFQNFPESKKECKNHAQESERSGSRGPSGSLPEDPVLTALCPKSLGHTHGSHFLCFRLSSSPIESLTCINGISLLPFLCVPTGYLRLPATE